MDSDLTPRQKAEVAAQRWRDGDYRGSPGMVGLVDAITTAIQKQSNEDLERHRAKRAALETDLAAANERCAELEATKEAVWDALQDAPELNPSNYDHEQVCELNSKMVEAYLTLKHDIPSTILAAVREKARREGAVEELKRVEIKAAKDCCDWKRDYFWVKLADLRSRIAALEVKG